VRTGDAPISPEAFGARGDGWTNDTLAFAKMATLINDRGGGAIELRPTTYIVGRQIPDLSGEYGYKPQPILNFVGCSRDLIINGNGARLRCAEGLRFGTFNPNTGSPTSHTLPYYLHGERSSPYFAMIHVQDCAGTIQIQDLELDGNLRALQIGGPWGDTGWQLGCVGLFLSNNLGSERFERVHAHDHGQDGFVIDGLSDRANESLFVDCTSDHNGRQGCSIVGGRNYVFRNSTFRNSGKGRLMSAPGAGVDIEAEGAKTIRNLTFEGCDFIDNAGVGLLADQGDSEGATFSRCKFVGTTSWSAWPNRPKFKFLSCDFVGSIVNAHGDVDPARATQFYDCRFRDDPRLSPTGEVYNARDRHPIADLPSARNVLFKRCSFDLTNRAVLPWSADRPIYEDCVMSQKEAKTAYPRGIYRGRNRIKGNVDLYDSPIHGELIVNGKLIPRRN
jgi:hypothetical protein